MNNVVKLRKYLLFDILQYWDNILERNKDLRGNNNCVWNYEEYK